MGARLGQALGLRAQPLVRALLWEGRLGVVHAQWPTPQRWPELLDSARRLDPQWHRWEVDGAARRAAEVIDAVATGSAR